MDRFTQNKSVSEMSEDARDLTMKLLDKYADIPNEFTCDDDFDDYMLDALRYGTNNILGLIAVFYQNIWAMADLREQLKEYEDIGTIDECREARKKQSVKRPKIIKVLKDEAYMECPCCKLTTVLYYGMVPDYCPKCGQALDHSDTEI